MPAALFDLDDTILDYSGGAPRCWAETCAALGSPAGLDVATLTAAVAAARRWFWSDPERHARERVRMLEAWGKIATAALDAVGRPSPALAAAMADDFAARRRAAMRLYPDALPCLAQLRARGVPLGLITNGDAAMQREKIDRFGIAPWFDVIVIEGEFGVGKPDRRVYDRALAVLDVAPAAVSMVGDNLEWDVGGAQRLGIRGVWIDRTGRGLPEGPGVRPDRVIRSLAELEVP